MNKNCKLVDRRRITNENENEKGTYRVVLIADTEDDVPEVQADWAPFSICFIAETGNCKVLNTQGVWVDV